MDEHVRLNILEHVRSAPTRSGVVAARAVGYVLLVGGTCWYALLIILLSARWIASVIHDPYNPDSTPAPTDPSATIPALLADILALAGIPAPLFYLLVGGIFVYIPIGIQLLRYGRCSVLYLRRFGYTDGTAVVTQAAASLGGRWRFVTLDDHTVVGQGPDSHEKWQASAVKKFSDRLETWSDRADDRLNRTPRWHRLGLLVVLVLLVFSFASDLFLPSLTLVFFALTVIGMGVLAVLTLAYYGIFAMLPTFLSLVLLPMNAAAGSIGPALNEADRGRFAEVDSAARVPGEVRRVKHLNRRVLAPRLAVLSVDTAIWREAVLGMAGVCRLALIDVSRPTHNIVWEIEQLTRLPRVRCVFIGEYGQLVEINERHVGEDEVVDAAVGLMAGRPVFAYHAGRDSADFVRALRSALVWSHRTARR